MALKRAVFNMQNFMKNPSHHLLQAPRETVDLHINDTKEFTKRGGVWTFDNTQRKVILKIPQSSPIGNGRCIFLVLFALICIGKSSLFQLVNIG
jgi:hypothetical protein